MLNIILFGAPGTGKGTQSEKIIEYYNLIHISTGDMLRDHITKGTNYGNLAKNLMDNGQLVPDSVVFRILYHKSKLHNNPKGFIFDGFPRNKEQAVILDNYLAKKELPIKAVFFLDVPEDELFKRILLRAQLTHRSDDNEETIRKRIKVYQDNTLPLLDYYKSEGKLIRINGLLTINEVFNDIKNHIDKIIE